MQGRCLLSGPARGRGRGRGRGRQLSESALKPPPGRPGGRGRGRGAAAPQQRRSGRGWFAADDPSQPDSLPAALTAVPQHEADITVTRGWQDDAASAEGKLHDSGLSSDGWFSGGDEQGGWYTGSDVNAGSDGDDLS